MSNESKIKDRITRLENLMNICKYIQKNEGLLSEQEQKTISIFLSGMTMIEIELYLMDEWQEDMKIMGYLD